MCSLQARYVAASALDAVNYSCDKTPSTWLVCASSRNGAGLIPLATEVTLEDACGGLLATRTRTFVGTRCSRTEAAACFQPRCALCWLRFAGGSEGNSTLGKY